MNRLTAILTRMNAGYKERLGDQADDWLRERFRLFERICLPSVKAQTDGGFAWLLLCDPDTPSWAVQALDDARSQCPQIVIDFTAHQWGCQAYQLAPRNAVIESGADWLMAFRLDNDDAAFDGLVEMLNAQPCETALYAFDNGYVYEGGMFWEMDWASSPFLALQTKRPNFISPLISSHVDSRSSFGEMLGCELPVRKPANGARAWIHSRHEANASGDADGMWVKGKPALVETLQGCGFPWLGQEATA